MLNRIGENVFVHETVRFYGRNDVGDNSLVLENVILGYPTTDTLVSMREERMRADFFDFEGSKIGHNAIIRSEAVIYANVTIGNYVRTGHKVLVRENSRIGDNVLIGTNVVIDNNTIVGSNVSIQSSVYIPTGTVIEDYVFLGPNCVLLNDMYPIRTGSKLEPPILRKGVTVGGNATIMPGIEVGEGAMIAASAVVRKEVPPWHFAIGAPARFKPLPEELVMLNRIE